MASFIYDVALSFAGEDREYVSKIADILRSSGVRVFYDEYERANLFGQELIGYLDDVYTKQSKHVVIFISKSYLAKEWTNHERKSALNRALKNITGDYILPIRLDDTKLPGLHESIGHLSAKKLSIMEIAETLFKKLGYKTNPNYVQIESILTLYRLCHKKYSKQYFSGIFDTRWSKKGEAILYTATNISLAYLETLVHRKDYIENFCLVQYSIPASVKIDSIYESELKAGWRTLEGMKENQEIGSNWLRKGETCILSVPSVIVPKERNFILNPKHPSYDLLQIKEITDVEFDVRLFNRSF